MTFKTILPLSIIAFFVTGSVLLAAEPQDHASSTAPTLVSAQTETASTTSATSSTSSTRVKATSSNNTTSQPAPAAKTKAKPQPVDPTSKETAVSPTPVHSGRSHDGYTVQQIRNMPMVARPDRPGHFFGNTVRAIYHVRRGR